MLASLSQFSDVDFLTPESDPGAESTDHRYWDNLSKFARILPSWNYHRLDLLLTARPYDWVIVEFWHQAEKLLPSIESVKRSRPGLRLLVDSVDVHYLRELSGLKQGIGEHADIAARKRRELAVYSQADLVAVVTPEDAQSLANEGMATPVVSIPNIVEIHERRSERRKESLLFIGGFQHQPNVDAIHWFVDSIFPLVLSVAPDSMLDIVGSHPPDSVIEIGQHPKITVHGFVPSTRRFLSDAAISIAPLRFGAGMKGKVTEALSHAIPVVTTSVGAQGLNAAHNRHMKIANDPQGFSDCILEFLADPVAAESTGKCGQELVAELCSSKRITKTLQRALLEPPTYSRHQSLSALMLIATKQAEYEARRAIKRLRSFRSLKHKPHQTTSG